MLEIVIAARNDDYGGQDFHERLCAAATHNHRVLDAAGIAHRFTLVEWNPLPGRRPLLDIIRESLPWWHAGITVDPAWHQALSTNPRLQFMEFFAKNAAVRRSAADLILTTNSDVFLSTELVQALTSTRWDDHVVYRAVRVDIDRYSPWREGERVFADEQYQLRVNDLQPPDYGNSAGDFLLLTRAAWHDLGAFNERVRYAKIHKDGQFCIHARLRGFAFETLGRIYHIDHDGSYANAGAMRGSPDAPYGPEWDYRSGYTNPRSWGVSSAVEVPGPEGTLRLRHPEDAGPALSILLLTEGRETSAPDLGQSPVEIIAAPMSAGVAPAVNAALARARGRVVIITSDSTLAAFGGRATVLDALSGGAVPGLFVPRGFLRHDPSLGALPMAGSPIGIRRDVLDALIDLDESAAAPVPAFWLLASEASAPGEVGHSGVVADGLTLAVPPDLAVRTLLRRGQTPDAALISDTGRHGAVAAAVEAMRAWVASLEASRIAVVGPDWATALFLEALVDSGRELVGVFTGVDGEAHSWRWGEQLRPLSELATCDVDVIVCGRAIPAWAIPMGIPVRVLDGAGATSAPPAELDLLRRAQARDLASARTDAVLCRLAALRALEGTGLWSHWYDAAQLVERQGNPRMALEFLMQVTGNSADAALADRAAFHVGRLLIEAGRPAEAIPALSRVLSRTPHHKAARALLTRAEAASLAVAG